MSRSGNPEDEPSYEEIGGGLIEDTQNGVGTAPVMRGAGGGLGWNDGGVAVSGPDLRGIVSKALAAVWLEWTAAVRSARFWLELVLGLASPAAVAAGLISWATAGQWFEQGGTWIGLVVIAAGFTGLSAAVLGTVWGFARPRTTAGSATAIRILASGAKGIVFAVSAGILVFLAGLPAGGAPGLAAAVAVVIVCESLLFSAVGAGSRACFRAPVPGGFLAGTLAAVLCGVNIVVTALLLPSTFVAERVSVPMNVVRDPNGRLASYECAGEPVRFEMALHSERVVWLGAGNPLVVFGAMAAGTVPTNNDVGWMLPTFQVAFEGAAREVACINGVASEELQPAPPVWLVGLAEQGAAAALVLVPARIISRRREAAAMGHESAANGLDAGSMTGEARG